MQSSTITSPKSDIHAPDDSFMADSGALNNEKICTKNDLDLDGDWGSLLPDWVRKSRALPQNVPKSDEDIAGSCDVQIMQVESNLESKDTDNIAIEDSARIVQGEKDVLDVLLEGTDTSLVLGNPRDNEDEHAVAFSHEQGDQHEHVEEQHALGADIDLLFLDY